MLKTPACTSTSTCPHSSSSDKHPLLPHSQPFIHLGWHMHIRIDTRYTNQRYIVRQKRAMYPTSGHPVYSPLRTFVAVKTPWWWHLGAETCSSWQLLLCVFGGLFYWISINAFCWFFKKMDRVVSPLAPHNSHGYSNTHQFFLTPPPPPPPLFSLPPKWVFR